VLPPIQVSDWEGDWCAATSATVPLWAVAPTTTDEEHDDHKQGHNQGDDPKDLHPARSATGVNVAGRLSHVRVLPVGRGRQ
jgi:hypothetical protein